MLYLLFNAVADPVGGVADGQNFVIANPSSAALSMVGLFLCHNVQLPVTCGLFTLFGTHYWLDAQLWGIVFVEPSAATL